MSVRPKLHVADESEIQEYIVNRRNLCGKFPSFRMPAEIGGFSLDINRDFHHDRSQLKYFIRPKDFGHVHLDLRKGYRSMIKKDESKLTYINDILRWIQQNSKKFAVASQNSGPDGADLSTSRDLHTDFICWRGLLTKFLCTPYENRDGWKIAVTFHNGTYYLCEFDTEKKKQDEANKTEKDIEMCCWGWKFEQYLTADSPDSKPDVHSPYNNCEAFCTMVRSRLNSHSLVYGGEVDALDVRQGENREQYVEFKTTKEISHPRQDISFKRFKLIKWWAQSFLVGIPEIVCGYRDDDGVVHRLETFHTQQIPDIAKSIDNPWQPNVCFNFLDQFLSHIKSTVTVDDYRVVHLFEWSPRAAIKCTRFPPNSEYRFLPDWYIKP